LNREPAKTINESGGPLFPADPMACW
jgi:hypothetical protein